MQRNLLAFFFTARQSLENVSQLYCWLLVPVRVCVGAVEGQSSRLSSTASPKLSGIWMERGD